MVLWFIVWPSQRFVLSAVEEVPGIVNALGERKGVDCRLTSRINTHAVDRDALLAWWASSDLSPVRGVAADPGRPLAPAIPFILRRAGLRCVRRP
jgi:hypothetical protein